MTNQTVKNSSSLKKSIRLIIVLVAVFAILLVGYLVILRPMLQEDETEAVVASYPAIWQSEVESVNGRVLMYPHFERSAIASISIHNPNNAKYGEQYVDWGFYRYTGPEKNENGLVVDEFYLQDYEYAPYDTTAFSNVIIAAGYTLSTARIEDHCSDYSRYGLDFATPEEALSVTLKTTDGKTYVYYVGDPTPSGGGYYVRVVGEDTLLSTGEVMERDSVYILAPTNLEAAVLGTPMKLVTPSLTLPFDTSSTTLMSSFRIWKNEPQYIVDEIQEDGSVMQKIKPAVYLKPLTDVKDPFTLFSGMGIYYSVSHPGRFSSLKFEALSSVFEEFVGTEVVEMATVMTDSEGEEYYGFTDEVRKKYFLDNPQYTLCYRYQDIDNYVYFSPLQEGSYYYAYSLTFNTINKVTKDQAYFLEWDDQSYLQNQLVFLNINNCDRLQISGSYYDLGLYNPDHLGQHSINETYQLSGRDDDLIVSTEDGKTLTTKYFREFYQVMVDLVTHETVSDAEAAEAMKGEVVATLSATTRRTVIYKTDANGNTTSEVDYVLESVTKKYRFYELSEGRLLCTIEQIDAEGNSSGESGNSYILTSRMDQLLAATVNLRENLPFDNLQRY